jgi:hypothetical protein
LFIFTRVTSFIPYFFSHLIHSPTLLTFTHAYIPELLSLLGNVAYSLQSAAGLSQLLMMIHEGFAKASSWCVTRMGIDVFQSSAGRRNEVSA